MLACVPMWMLAYGGSEKTSGFVKKKTVWFDQVQGYRLNKMYTFDMFLV